MIILRGSYRVTNIYQPDPFERIREISRCVDEVPCENEDNERESL